MGASVKHEPRTICFCTVIFGCILNLITKYQAIPIIFVASIDSRSQIRGNLCMGAIPKHGPITKKN